MHLFGTGVPGGFRGKAPEDIPSPCIWKPQIARKLTSWMLFLSEFFQYNDDFYGDFHGDFYGDTFVATNFQISLFLFFPLYDFNFILLASQRASQRASLAKGGGFVAPTNPPGYAPGSLRSKPCNDTFQCKQLCNICKNQPRHTYMINTNVCLYDALTQWHLELAECF